MKLIQILLGLMLVLTVGCTHSKPATKSVNTLSYSDGWSTVAEDNWSFKLPTNFYIGSSAEELGAAIHPNIKASYKSIDGYIQVSFSTEDTKYDLETYSTAILAALEQSNVQWSSRQGKIGDKDAILIVAYMPYSTLFHVNIIEKNIAYNFNCAVHNASDDNGTICGKICKTIKIK